MSLKVITKSLLREKIPTKSPSVEADVRKEKEKEKRLQDMLYVSVRPDEQSGSTGERVLSIFRDFDRPERDFTDPERGLITTYGASFRICY